MEKNKLWIISLCVLLLCCFGCGSREIAKPYSILKQNLMEAEGIVEEGFLGANHEKLSAPVWIYRQLPPTSFCVKFDSFATMSKQVKTGKYESSPFSVGGYNWSLVIHPNGNQQDNVKGYISAYAKIHNSSLMTNDVYAEIKFFIYSKIKDQYYTLQDNEPKRFHMFKPEWGMPNLIALSTFIAAANGFVFDGGQSVFGIDVFVTPPFKRWEVFSNEDKIRDPIFNWKLSKFSTLDCNSYTSDSFSSGGKNWLLKVYPNGVGPATGNALSLFLLSASNVTDFVQAKLRVLDQIRLTHFEKQVEGWPNATENGWGLDKFIPLADLRNATKGFVVNDTLKVEVEIVSFSKTNFFSL
ncbi:MATH/TRAF domain-containing protein [Hirschfeldia incana]|nr:MATH/TRAF domain-containing protein [Hirschfeldia incana]